VDVKENVQAMDFFHSYMMIEEDVKLKAKTQGSKQVTKFMVKEMNGKF
jgi:hypothetical protein